MIELHLTPKRRLSSKAACNGCWSRLAETGISLDVAAIRYGESDNSLQSDLDQVVILKESLIGFHTVDSRAIARKIREKKGISSTNNGEMLPANRGIIVG